MKKILIALILPIFMICFNAEARVIGINKILDAQSMGASFQSSSVDVSKVDLVSVQIVWSGGGSPNGSFEVQVSNDDLAGVTWTTYPSSAIAITTDGDLIYNVANLGSKWVRIAYTRTSGTGSATAMLVTKEENDR